MKSALNPLTIALLSSLALAGCGSGEEEKEKKKTSTEIEEKTVTLSIKSELVVKEPASGFLSSSVSVELNDVYSEDVTFTYSIDPLTATENVDYEGVSGEGIIQAGARSADIPFTILGDALDEDDEVFTVTLNEVTNATLSTRKYMSTITILDEDPKSEVGFSTEFVSIAEGSGIYEVIVSISPATERDVKIPFTLAGLATQGDDYTILTQSPITVPTGASEVRVKFDILQDDRPEGGEQILLVLGEATNADLGYITAMTLMIPGDIGLNDTGVDTYFDGTSFTSTSPNSDYPNQDADFGRDTTHTERFDGHKGFSYTKLDKSGNALASNANDFKCIQDNQTGLVWEVKQEPQTLTTETVKDELAEQIKDALDEGIYAFFSAHTNWQATNYLYYWYNSDKKTNGGSEGAEGAGFANGSYPISVNCAFQDKTSPSYAKRSDCNTKEYQDAMNKLSICGFKDWRLPRVNELTSLHNYAVSQKETSNTDYFPNTAEVEYLTSDPSADGTGAVWCVSSTTGQAKLCKKQLPNAVRMVRGGSL